MKKIAILGGTGFTGSYIIDELVRFGYNVKMINRKKIPEQQNRSSQVIINLNSDLLYKELQDCDSVIYNIGIIREFPKEGISFKNLHQDLAIHAIDMAERADVRKFILMSANGVEKSLTNYGKTKFKAEQYLMSSKLNWTIFRPSLIFGDPRGKMEFCTQIKRDMVSLPLPVPIFFNGINILNAGSFKMSPIHVKNIAEFFVRSIDREESKHQIYELGGSRSFSWEEIINIISKSCNKNKWRIPVPILFVKFLAFFLDSWSWFPVSRDQLTLLSNGNVCKSQKYFNDFGIDEITFDVKNLSYLL